MCGRYTLKTPVNVLAEQFQIDEYPSSMNASYNIAPTQEVAAVIEGEGKRKGQSGYIPATTPPCAGAGRGASARRSYRGSDPRTILPRPLRTLLETHRRYCLPACWRWPHP
jgi:putative SOS response-associated peptidase YedK